MKKKSAFFLYILFLCVSFMSKKSFSQNVDSLENLLVGKNLSTTDQIEIYDDLSWFYQNTNMRKSVDHGFSGLKLAQQNDDETMEATFYRNIGVAYYMGSVYDSAQTNLDRSLKIVRKIKDRKLESALYVAFGNLYRMQSRYNDAIDNYLKAIEILEHRKDRYGVGLVYSNIGGVYQVMHNYEQALSYFDKARIIAEETNNQEGLADIYISLSDIELYLGNDKDQSLHYAEEALMIYKGIGNVYKENYAMLLLSKIYYHHEDFTKANTLAQEVLQKATNLGFPALTTNSFIHISNIHYRQGRYAASAEAAMRVLEVDTTDTNLTINAYLNLIRSNAFLGKPEVTVDYLKRYGEALDRYSNKEFQNSLSEMEVKYQTEKKEIRINTLEKERILYGVIFAVSLLGIIILLGALYLRQRAKKRLAEQQVFQLKKEKQLIATHAILEGEATERTRLARDLHDGLGGMLSAVKLNLFDMKKGNAILASDDVIQFNKVIDMLDSSITELRRVAHNMMPESLSRYGLKVSLQDFCNSMSNVHFHFFGNEKRLENTLEIMIYRSVHELVNNAVKHAEAENINVQIIQEPDRISLTVQDDGKGFEVKSDINGTGLNNIRTRAESVGGTMNVYSEPGKGTEVNVEFKA